MYDFMFQAALVITSRATMVKYIRTVRRITEFLQDEELTKLRLPEYRELLMGQMKAQTVNDVLSAIHAFLDFLGLKTVR